MEVLKSFLESLFAVSMNIISFALKLAPVWIMFLAFDFGARLGLALLASMSMYSAVAIVVSIDRVMDMGDFCKCGGRSGSFLCVDS